MPEQFKQCCSCKQSCAILLFGTRGQHRACRQCRTNYQKKWNAKNKDKLAAIQKKCREKRRERNKIAMRVYYSREDIKLRKRETRRRSRLKTRFGITAERYEEILTQQNGACAICLIKPSTRRLAVDHCHATGVVRGLLCSHCNTVLGLMCESADRMESAIKYLKAFKNA